MTQANKCHPFKKSYLGELTAADDEASSYYGEEFVDLLLWQRQPTTIEH